MSVPPDGLHLPYPVAAIPAWGMVLLVLGAIVSGGLFHALICASRWHQLLHAVRRVRHGHENEFHPPITRGLAGELAAEFERLFHALDEARHQLGQTSSLIERRVVHRTETLERAVRRLRKIARTDELTGLANRQYFDEYLRGLFEQVCETRGDLACLMIDIDYFKEVNDTLGHAAGDELIALAGEVLRACVREHDLCGRYGGDEFVVLLQDISEAEALAVAERIRRMFQKEAARFRPPNDAPGDVPGKTPDRPTGRPEPRLSIGLASCRRHGVRDPYELLRLADAALYQAKRGGRNRVAVYDPANSNGLRAAR